MAFPLCDRDVLAKCRQTLAAVPEAYIGRQIVRKWT